MIRDFVYFSANTIKEALDLLEQHKDDYKIICGGQSLLILMRQGLVTPKNLIDIKRVEVLRDELGLKGTKRGCNTGACCACTVLLNRVPVKSCSVLAMQADGAEVTTVEGLADKAKLNPLQRSFLDHGAYQCGFCTSGMLMSATALLNEKSSPTKEEIKEGIHGNICRCTGYNSIIRAVMAVAEGKYKEEEG